MQLQTKEKILFQAQPKSSVIVIWLFTRVLGGIITSFIFVLFFGISTFSNAQSFTFAYALLLVVAFIIGILVYLMYLVLLRKTFTYTVTNQQVVFEGGIFTKRQKMIPYHKITHTEISRNIAEQFLNIATLNIFTASVGLAVAEISFTGLDDADKPLKIINEHLKKLQSTGE